MSTGTLVERIRRASAESRRETRELLRSLVEVNSHWGNPAGLNRVAGLAAAAMPACLERTGEVDANGVVHNLFSTRAAGRPRSSPAFRESGQRTAGPLLLVGHLDTVFPPGPAAECLVEEGGLLRGPGTADMKGGVTVMIAALRLLHGLGLLAGIPLRCLLNADEEIGSPFSSRLVRELAREAGAGLVFECGGRGGTVVTARRGVRRYRLSVAGRAGHAGMNTGSKASAIKALCDRVLALEELNAGGDVTVNVGRIEGGTAANVISESAEAEFETRYWDVEGEETARQAVEGVAGVAGEGCSGSLALLHRRPPMNAVPGSDALVGEVRDCAGLLGQATGTEVRGGASDANWISFEKTPCLDGLGPVGEEDHSPGEFIVADSLYERVELTALLLTRLAGTVR